MKVCGFRVEFDGIFVVIEIMFECRRVVSLKLDDCNFVSFVMFVNVDVDRIKVKIVVELFYYYLFLFILVMD